MTSKIGWSRNGSMIGEIAKASELGRKGAGRFQKYIWHTCTICGKERWVQLRWKQPQSIRCRRCSVTGSFATNWKGGRAKDGRGYIKVQLQPDNFFFPMAMKSGYVFEHRLVVAKALGSCLQLWEIVHHKEGFAKDDNRYPETLQLVTDDRHKQITLLEIRIKRLEQQVLTLEAENILLKEGVSSEQNKNRMV